MICLFIELKGLSWLRVVVLLYMIDGLRREEKKENRIQMKN